MQYTEKTLLIQKLKSRDVLRQEGEGVQEIALGLGAGKKPLLRWCLGIIQERRDGTPW